MLKRLVGGPPATTSLLGEKRSDYQDLLNSHLRSRSKELSFVINRIEKREDESLRFFAVRSLQSAGMEITADDLQPEERDRLLIPYLSANNLVEKPKLARRRAMRLRMIDQAFTAGVLTVDGQSHLQRLCDALPMKPPTISLLYHVAEHIPEALLWDFAFGARASTEYSDRGFPVLETHKAHSAVFEYVGHIFGTYVLSAGRNAEQRAQIVEMFKAIVRELSNLHAGSFGWAYWQGAADPCWWDFERSPAAAVEFGAISFAELHELGHVALGHLDRPRDVYDENAADLFAVRAICGCQLPLEVKSLMLVGMELAFGFYIALKLAAQDAEAHKELLLRLAALNDAIGHHFGKRAYYGALAMDRGPAVELIGTTLADERFVRSAIRRIPDQFRKLLATPVNPQPDGEARALYSSFTWEIVNSKTVSQQMNRLMHECTLEPSSDTGFGATVHAPTPWHAWVFLVRHNLDSFLGVGGPQAPLFYRGQANCNWDLVASIHRPTVDIEEETQAAQAFASLIGHHLIRNSIARCYQEPPPLIVFTEQERVPPELHLAAAQHYGLRTPLLDFTTDPDVAIWFACQSPTDDDCEASVFAFSSASPHARILFPPPYVRRLYRQRGVFVDSRTLSPAELKKSCIEVRFRPNAEFAVARNGLKVDLLGQRHDVLVGDSDYWWLHQVKVARTIVREGRLQDLLSLPTGSLEASQMSLAHLLGDLDNDFFPPLDGRLIIRSAADLLDILLAFGTHNSDKRFTVPDQSLRILKESGEFSIRLMLPILRSYVMELPRNQKRSDVESLLAAIEAHIPSWFNMKSAPLPKGPFRPDYLDRSFLFVLKAQLEGAAERLRPFASAKREE